MYISIPAALRKKSINTPTESFTKTAFLTIVTYVLTRGLKARVYWYQLQ